MSAPNSLTISLLKENPEARRRLAAVYQLLLGVAAKQKTAEASEVSQAQDASAAGSTPDHSSEVKE